MTRLAYTPFVACPPHYQSSNFVPQSMMWQLEKAFEQVHQTLGKDQDRGECLLSWIKDKLQMGNDIFKVLSPEQLDALVLLIHNHEHGLKDFVLADTMGNGKGRILACVVRYALINQRKCAFFTISDNLFSAFYQDLCAVGVFTSNKRKKSWQNPNIFMVNPSATIINEHGEKVMKSPSKMSPFFSNPLDDKVQNSQLLFCTYSQLNTEKAFQTKQALLKQFIKKDNFLIFDEFHKSLGDSTTKQSREQMIAWQASVVRSSATFLSKYHHINSYQEFFYLSAQDKMAVSSLAWHDNLTINAHLARSLSEKGWLIRRENKETADFTYVKLDADSEARLKRRLQALRTIFYALFEVHQRLPKPNKTKWGNFGAMMNRLAQFLVLVSKKECLIARTEEALANNQKVLITLESTFEANIIDAMQMEKGKQAKAGDYQDLSFKSLLNKALEDLIDGNLKKQDLSVQKAQQLINDFEPIAVSFIDEFSRHFEQKNIAVLEISGRTHQAIATEDGYRVLERKNEDKNLIAHQFNNETDKNIIVLTLSGSTGISLHANQSFKDQRQRRLIEAQISDRESEREQFFGRHNRRGQVQEAISESLISDTLVEKRKIQRNDRKAERMQSFTANFNSESQAELTHSHLQKVATQWFKDNDDTAQALGWNGNPHESLDLLLKRSLLLSDSQQEWVGELLRLSEEMAQRHLNHFQNEVVRHWTDNLQFKGIKTLWQSPFTTEADKAKLKDLPLLQKLNNPYGALFGSTASTESTLTVNDVATMRQEMEHHAINHNAFCPLQKDFSVGKQIVFTFMQQKMYGYINRVNPPPTEYLRYANLWEYEIVLINPQELAENNRVLAQTMWVSLEDLKKGKAYLNDKPINWDKYARHGETISTTCDFLLGNPFYLILLNNAHHLGTALAVAKDINDRPEMLYTVRLPNTTTHDSVRAYLNQHNIILSISQAHTVLRTHDLISLNKNIRISLRTRRLYLHRNWAMARYIPYTLGQNLVYLEYQKPYFVYQIPQDHKFFNKLMYFMLFTAQDNPNFPAVYYEATQTPMTQGDLF